MSGGGKGVGKKQHLLTSLEMTYNLLTPSDQLTPKIQKKLRILFFDLNLRVEKRKTTLWSN